MQYDRAVALRSRSLGPSGILLSAASLSRDLEETCKLSNDESCSQRVSTGVSVINSRGPVVLFRGIKSSRFIDFTVLVGKDLEKLSATDIFER
jgi:hypothetical protein